jgi:hypothetical protein
MAEGLPGSAGGTQFMMSNMQLSKKMSLVKSERLRKMSTRNMDEKRMQKEKYTLSEDDDKFNMERKGTYVNFTGEFDEEFPYMAEEEILPW